MEYLDNIDNLEYIVRNDTVQLMNLHNVPGMQVAEVITYLQDDGYWRCGSMASRKDNGFLRMEKVELEA